MIADCRTISASSEYIEGGTHPGVPHARWLYAAPGLGAWILDAAPADGVFRVVQSDGSCVTLLSALVAERAGERVQLGCTPALGFPDDPGSCVWRFPALDLDPLRARGCFDLVMLDDGRGRPGRGVEAAKWRDQN